MASDEISAVDERLSRLETTVANGFHEDGKRFGVLDGRMGRLEGRMGRLEDRMDRLEGRMDRLEDRMSALENKLDVVADSIRADLKTILEAVTAGTEEMRRITDAIRKEHQADRRLIMSILDDHSHRLRALEGRGPAATN